MRRKPYTEIGIRRMPCSRCGEPSLFQWNACCLKGQFFPICLSCDVALNELVVKFIGFNNADAIIEAYRKKLNA